MNNIVVFTSEKIDDMIDRIDDDEEVLGLSEIEEDYIVTSNIKDKRIQLDIFVGDALEKGFTVEDIIVEMFRDMDYIMYKIINLSSGKISGSYDLYSYNVSYDSNEETVKISYIE